MSAVRGPITIALLGGGTVGAEVARMLLENASDLEARIGAPVRLTGVAVRDVARVRRGIPADLITADAVALANSGADIVVELMGGIEPARSLILSAMAAKSAIVTANKALLAADGATLYAAAAKNDVDLYFEASVAGAIPLLRPLRESLAGDTVRRVLGIVNGTTNFILTKMDEQGADYAEVLVPDGKIAMGKLAQAVVHGATLLQVQGNFDDCLTLARDLSDNYPVALVNSVNPHRIEGQKTASFEIVDMLGNAPDIHCLPVGNAGNITAYWKGYREYEADGIAKQLPRMWGFQAEGSAPIVRGEIVKNPETIATAIRIGNPASWDQAINARDESGGHIDAVSDIEILDAYRLLASREGLFCEPSSAASVAGLLKMHAAGQLDSGQTVVCTLPGNGLKDVHWALEGAPEPVKVPIDATVAARALGLER